MLERLSFLWFALCVGVMAVGPRDASAAFPAQSQTFYCISGTCTPSMAQTCTEYDAAVANISNAAHNPATGRCEYDIFGSRGGTDYSQYQGPLSCPDNARLSGAQCNCNSGYQQQGSTCVRQQTEQELLCESLNGLDTYITGGAGLSPGGTSCNPTGCALTVADTIIKVTTKTGQTIVEGAATFNGATCQYSAESGAQEDTCPNGTKGTVNGVEVCAAYDPNLNTIESTKKSEETVQEGSDTTQTTKQSVTRCTNGSCNTTTTTTTVRNGTPTTKTETKTEPQADFCKDNPRAAQCSQQGTFAGSCGSFACTGDAVQCAQARAASELLCAADKLPPGVSDVAASVLGQDMPDGLFINGPSLQAPTAVTGSCTLTDLEVPLIFDYALPVRFSGFCQYMDTIRMVIGVFGALAFALIVFRS